ncbi:hypothetical protein BCR44DRAFT_36402 [Catenaria anguillulae PL171]|uniref:Uncharacterized protein n=1 Tax=Catenaria anguillulae PL171 TaxID=765915 RepID=A0A1Y2H9B5_9FUNG|nr:hypothetical protein BCR44DRAFT_36402 [Catenaria anguillulae PL171]
MSGSVSPVRRHRANPLSKLAHASDSNHSLNSSGSHASLDTITSEREMTTPTPPPPHTLTGRSQAGGAGTGTGTGGGTIPSRGRTGARLAQPPGATGPGTSKYMHTLNLAPPITTGMGTGAAAGGVPTSSARTTAASTLLARSRSNSRHRQASTESTGSMDRGLDSNNPHSSTDAISAPPGVGPNRISQLAPTLADRARVARLELAELQSDASAAMKELEAAEAMRKEAEAARMQSERDVESVQRRIEVALKKRDELEELLEGLRAENDELEQQLAVSGGFLNRYAGFVEGRRWGRQQHQTRARMGQGVERRAVGGAGQAAGV